MLSVLFFLLTALFFSLRFKQGGEIAFCDNQLLRLIPQFPVFILSPNRNLEFFAAGFAPCFVAALGHISPLCPAGGASPDTNPSRKSDSSFLSENSISIGSFLIGQQFGITPFGHPVKNKKVPEPDIGKTDIWLRDTFLIFCLLTEAALSLLHYRHRRR